MPHLLWRSFTFDDHNSAGLLFSRPQEKYLKEDQVRLVVVS